MIERLIQYCIKNRLLVVILFFFVIGWGLWAAYHTPVDAIPDLSDNQVIVYTEWMGRSPQVVEDQITYPLATNLQGLPKVNVVRAQSFFGFSMVYVIFEDDVDIYWARTRVLERLNSAQGLLPEGVTPTLGPDGTGVGHVYWYTVEGEGFDLGELRALQDWYIRYQLSSVPGVAEVASIGGFVKQYQIDVDPVKLKAFNVDFRDIIKNVKRSNNDVGGKLLEMTDMEYVIRGTGYIEDLDDLNKVVISKSAEGTPVFLEQVATIQMGGDIRRGLLDKNGEGEVVGGIIVMRYGENAKEVIDNVKKKIKEVEVGLPEGVKIHTAYDRSGLIERAINTLKKALSQEIIIVSLIVIFFLFHFRSALSIIISLPVSVLVALIFMKYLNITSNIMSLGGVAIAIGVLVDASVVMVENAYSYLAERQPKTNKERIEIISEATCVMGRPIFFALIIIILSFLPVFLLEGQEGKLFKPLAFTKTFAMIGSAFIAITLIPALLVYFMKGKFKRRSEHPITKFLEKYYRIAVRWAFNRKKIVLIGTGLLFLIAMGTASTIGKEFMPSLDEGSLLFMPVTLPNVTVTEAKRVMQVQDKIISEHPEVSYVLGKVGRAETATDPAPVSMIETIILLKPRSEWRRGITKDDIISELDAKLQIPGVSNAWTQPIINRINMLSTGVRTDLGIKIFGPDLETLQTLAFEAEKIIREVPGAVDLYAERVHGGKFLDIDVDREAAARFGMTVGDLQDFIETAIGGMNVSTSIEGRYRFPIRLRYAKDFRGSPEDIKKILVSPPSKMGRQDVYVPLEQLAKVEIVPGPPMINTENSMPRAVVFLNVRGRDVGGFVDEAKDLLAKRLKLPEGYYVSWSGQYENQIRAKKRLSILIPAVAVIILIILYLTFHSWIEGAIVLLSVPFALIGGILLQKILGYNFSVAVWVGYIALAGVVVETAIVMITYLKEALREFAGRKMTVKEVEEAVISGAARRLRPILMTESTSLIALLPIMWATGTGADVMKPLATPLIGGQLSALITLLFVIPIVFSMWITRSKHSA